MLVDRLNSFIGVDDMNRANHSETESGAIADMWKYATMLPFEIWQWVILSCNLKQAQTHKREFYNVLALLDPEGPTQRSFSSCAKGGLFYYVYGK